MARDGAGAPPAALPAARRSPASTLGAPHPRADAARPRSPRSCAVALLAQFYPGKPPATTPLLVACVTTYALLSVALTWLAARVEKDAFLFTRATARTPSLAISSKMDRFGADYKLSIEARGGGGGGGPAAAATLAAPDFLRADGVLLAPALARRVGDMLDRVEAAAKKKA